MVKLLFSVSPDVSSSVVLVDIIGVSFEDGLEISPRFSGELWASSFFSTVGVELSLSELAPISVAKLFSVEAKTPWVGANKETPISTEATPTENFRIEKRCRLLKISFI